MQAVIFDRDGVLTYFELEPARAYFRELLSVELEELVSRWQAYGARAGFPRSVDEERAFWRGYWASVCGELEVSAAVEREARSFDYGSAVRAFADARPALSATRARGLKVGVLSNFTLASLDSSLEAAGLADLVDAACAAPVIGAAKPVAAAYRAALGALETTPEESLFFDDEPECVAGARELGMRAYLVDRRRATHNIEGGIVRDLSALDAVLASVCQTGWLEGEGT